MKKNYLFPALLIIVVVSLFACCNNRKDKISDYHKELYLSKGGEIVKESFVALSSELNKAMAAGGVHHAVSYCDIKAIPIIETLSEKNKVVIRRASDRYRNAEDKPGKTESEILDQYILMQNEGKELAPLLLRGEDGVVNYFAPIVIKTPLCLYCHGVPGETIKQSDYDYIKSIYPADEAIGYKEGDLRGIWSVRFVDLKI